MLRFSKLAMALAVAPVLFVSGSALADSPGQLTGGSPFVVVKNVTQKGSYGASASAACSEEVEYSIRLHNAAYGGLTNIQVSANLASGKISAVPAEGASQGATGSVAVSLPSNGTLAYESGTTELFDANGNVVKTLPDGITTAGVNAGNEAGSTTEFVNFKAKVTCPPVTPPQVSFACTALDVNQIDRTHYDFTAHGTATNATISGYSFTAKDANGNTVDTNTVSTNANSAVYHFNQTNAGTYTVSATLNTDHGSNSNSSCVKQVTVASVPTTPTTPATTSLPNTGPGDVLELFAGTSAFGGVGHYIVSRRRRN